MAPVLRRRYPAEFVKLTDLLEACIDELPGARRVGADLAAILTRTAAGAVEHSLGAARDRADPAILVQNAGPAGGTLLRPDALLLQDANESRVQTRLYGLVVEALRNRLDAGAAAERKDRVIPLDGLGRLLDEDVVALTLDGQLLDRQIDALKPRRNAQG